MQVIGLAADHRILEWEIAWSAGRGNVSCENTILVRGWQSSLIPDGLRSLYRGHVGNYRESFGTGVQPRIFDLVCNVCTLSCKGGRGNAHFSRAVRGALIELSERGFILDGRVARALLFVILSLEKMRRFKLPICEMLCI